MIKTISVLGFILVGLSGCNNTISGLRQDASSTAEAIDQTLNGTAGAAQQLPPEQVQVVPVSAVYN